MDSHPSDRSLPSIVVDVPRSSPQIDYGVELLSAALERSGHHLGTAAPGAETLRVIVAPRGTAAIDELEAADVLLYNVGAPRIEGYALVRLPGQIVVVTGHDDTGVLYGCQELARIIDRTGEIPRDLDHAESPDMLLRGPAIGLQKTTVEPPRQVYEYPITPERFPWFYDRPLWTTVLDRLFDDRANAIYLWSGHPFSSLVRTPGFPEAQEVSDAELESNQEVLHWLIDEAHRRGIRVFMKFYNIHIPLPFAAHHEIELHQPRPTPLVSRYTRAAVAALVSEFPDMGLYVCLGEVLQGAIYGEEWLVETIIPGVQDAIAASNITDHPPILLRSHHIDPGPVLDAARRHYPRIYTEAKYNGESLTTWNPRGEWQQQHQMLASKAEIHAANVHILADLEPFRYSAFTFIQRSTRAMLHRLHATGLHLYPLFYWDWPYAPDATSPRLLQIDRDRLWFSAWFRYAWKADRDPAAESAYWDGILAEQFGDAAGTDVVAALEAMGQITPRLIRRLGITEGNRQTFALGMTMSQLTHPEAHRPWPDLWDSHAPGGERLDEYVARDERGEAHVGETPIDVIEDARHFAARAVAAVERARPHVSRDNAEFERIAADAAALAELAEFTALRTLAAIDIVRYRLQANAGGTADRALLTGAVERVEASLENYRRLTEITSERYLYANSMRTPQRRVPFPDGEKHDHWVRCLPLYEQEFANFAANVAALDSVRAVAADEPQERFAEMTDAHLRITGGQAFELGPGAAVFASESSGIEQIAPELLGLQAVRIARGANAAGGIQVQVTLPRDGHVLLGYVASTDEAWLQVPNLETNTHADARGGLDPVLHGAIQSAGIPDINVHAFRYEAGEHTIALDAGAFVVLGVVEQSQEFTGRSVVAASDDDFAWLYEERTDESA